MEEENESAARSAKAVFADATDSIAVLLFIAALIYVIAGNGWWALYLFAVMIAFMFLAAGVRSWDQSIDNEKKGEVRRDAREQEKCDGLRFEIRNTRVKLVDEQIVKAEFGNAAVRRAIDEIRRKYPQSANEGIDGARFLEMLDVRASRAVVDRHIESIFEALTFA